MQLHKIDFKVAALGAILAASFSAITLAILTPLNDVRSAAVVIGSLFVFLPFCLFGAFAVGLPIFVVLLRMNLIRWWVWVPLSLALGTGLAVVFGYTPDHDHTSLVAALSVAFLSAVAFRVVWAISSKWRLNSDRQRGTRVM
jgi:hypothetical protein